MVFIAYAFKGHVHAFARLVKVVTCKSLVLQGKCNIEIFLSPGTHTRLSTYIVDIVKLKILFLLNGESPKYIAKLFSLSMLILTLQQWLSSIKP